MTPDELKAWRQNPAWGTYLVLGEPRPGISQTLAAKLTKRSRTYYNSQERGKNPITPELIALVEANPPEKSNE